MTLIERPDPSQANMPVVIMDIDGTLANADHRVHLIASEPKNWPAFLAAAEHDTVNPEIRALNNTMFGTALIFILTGRSSRDRQMTKTWLSRHGILYDRLMMRPEDDRREDTIVKSEMLDALLAEGHKILFAVEDRRRVVRMWRERGIRALHVTEGDY